MGKLSLILVISAFLTTGLMMHRANNTAIAADEKLWAHQSNVLARDAASTGLSATVRALAGHLNQNWQALALARTDVPHNGGTYSVAVVSGSTCSVLSSTLLTQAMGNYTVTNATRDVIEVRATGRVGDERHQMVACYLQADWNDPMPPSFLYSFISNDKFTFNGGIEVVTLSDSLGGHGNIHSNQTMYLGPQVVVEGHATVTNFDDKNTGVHKNAEVVTFGSGPGVPMVAFDAEAFRVDNGLPPASAPAQVVNSTFRYDTGNVKITGNVTIRDPAMPADRHADQPYIWFVNGDLEVSNNAHLIIPDHTIIVVKGEIKVSGQANVTVTGTLPPDKATDAQLKAWVQSQHIDGQLPLAWYSTGHVTLGGGSSVVGNFYTNGNFTLGGGGKGGNLIGSVAAMGEVTGNGGGGGTNFFYSQIGQQHVIPGVLLPGRQLVRIALAEWTNPVLTHTPDP